MRYQGSKKKLANKINEIAKNFSNICSIYVEPFCGGANSLSAIDFDKKLTSDSNKYVIAFWNDVKNNNFNQQMWDFVKNLTKEQYYDIKANYLNNTNKYKDSIIGYVGTACSYGGSWWNGYANFNPNKNENHILEAFNGTIKQIDNFISLNNTDFIFCDYKNILNYFNNINQEKAFIYCDPPYQATKGYKSDFNSNEFWEWCRNTINNNHILLISEYNAPDDFIQIHQKNLQDGMSSINKNKCEKLFVHKSQLKMFK